jgi:hypothetical protein
MTLTPNQKLDLLTNAKDRWLDAESYSHAYDHALKVTKRNSEVLKIGTILAALLTTASGFLEATWITVTTGLLTTALATIDRLYAPSDNFQKIWDCRADLDLVKQDLTNISLTIDSVSEVNEGALPITQAGQKIIEAAKRLPIPLRDEDRQKADKAFHGKTMDRIIRRAEMVTGAIPEEREDMVGELPEDAPNVVAAYRPVSG